MVRTSSHDRVRRDGIPPVGDTLKIDHYARRVRNPGWTFKGRRIDEDVAPFWCRGGSVVENIINQWRIGCLPVKIPHLELIGGDYCRGI